MVNVTGFQDNSAQVPVQKTTSIEVWVSIMIPFFLSYFCFLYLISVLLSVYFTTPHVQENGRYILFAHMLINDFLYITIAVSLFWWIIFKVYFPVTICYFIVTVSSMSFIGTPYNLAAMSLERYIAICFPLRHAEFCTRHRIGYTIALIWTIGLIPNIADFIILASSVNMDFFAHNVLCRRSTLTNTTNQSILRSFVHAFTFSLVAMIIVFTYVKIMLVARKIDSGKALASKASKTVILHAIQLLLCMTAFSYPITESYVDKNFLFLPTINFCLFMCLPRFLSPLIYGIRDEAFRASLRRYVLCKPVRANADQFTH